MSFSFMEKTSLLYVFVVGQTYIFILTGSFSFVIRLKSFSVPQAKLVVFFDYSNQDKNRRGSGASCPAGFCFTRQSRDRKPLRLAYGPPPGRT
jgi:hypothetical protein